MGPAARGYVPVLHAATRDRPDEIDTIFAAEAVAAALTARGYAAEVIALGPDLSGIDQLPARRPRVVFNLADAVEGDGRLAPMVPARLDALGLIYTGAGTCAWLDTLSKIATKLKIAHAGLPTPGWSSDGRDLEPSGEVIVKPVWEHGSLGMDETCVMRGSDAAQAILEREARWKTEHFAEEFIGGREFNVSLIETRDGVEVLPIAEIVFEGFGEGTPRIVGYDAKWTPDSAAFSGTPRRFGIERENATLAAELAALSRACWALFGVQGYARVDFRVTPDGRPFILEINMNPCLTPDAGFAAAAQEADLTYEDLIERIAEAPQARFQASA
jgi:D-alanine-D-alanine ligase